MRRFFFILGTVSALLLFVPSQTQAANLKYQIIPSCDQTQYEIQNKTDGTTKTITPEEFDKPPYPKADWEVTGYSLTHNCGFNDFLQIFVNLFNWGLYILSILALFFFFLGGGTLLLSGGSEERVRAGKAILVNTVIGLIIALASWTIVNLTMNALLPEGQRQQAGAALIGAQPWFRTSPSTGYQKCGDIPQYPCKESEKVKQVQEMLLNAQCYINPGPRSEVIDGSFGPKTLEAWHNWQQANAQGVRFDEFGVEIPPTATLTDTLSGYDNFDIPCFTNSDLSA
jgi:hypothetical protein